MKVSDVRHFAALKEARLPGTIENSRRCAWPAASVRRILRRDAELSGAMEMRDESERVVPEIGIVPDRRGSGLCVTGE